MSINIDRFELPITPNEALQIVQAHTDRLGVFLDLDRIYEMMGIYKLRNTKIGHEANQLCPRRINLNDTTDVRRLLIEMGVSPNDLKLNKADSVSAKVLLPLYEEGLQEEDTLLFMKLYLEYSSNKHLIGNLNSWSLLPRCKALSFNGHRMVLARSKYTLLATSRIQASDPNVQGIARTLGDLITHPSGFILLRTDSGQIEPRINFSYFLRDELIVHLIMYYNDAYFGLLHFCTMSDAERNACRIDFDFNFKPIIITNEIADMRQTLKTLTNAGSYGSSNLGNVEQRLASSYDKLIVNHPSRLELERKVTEQINRGDNTFYGVFGTPITPTATQKYSEDGAGWRNHVLRCGINNPVQTTASELMIHSVYNANKILLPCKHSGICYYKHDEGAFLLSEKEVEGTNIVEELSDITAYNVKGWIPIPADSFIGVKQPNLPSYL